MTTTTTEAPALCPACRESRRKWRLIEYDPRHPCEWPGLAMFMDARTSHATRRADWQRKTADQIALIERICADNHKAEEAPCS